LEILKQLHEGVLRKRPELWPKDWFFHRDNVPSHTELSIKQFLAQKSITETKHLPYSPDLAPNDFWLFPKVRFALKGWIFQDIKDITKKWQRHRKLSHNRNYKNVSNSSGIVGLSA
jgi:hypothetical protein